jgi:hypothetical protein
VYPGARDRLVQLLASVSGTTLMNIALTMRHNQAIAAAVCDGHARSKCALTMHTHAAGESTEDVEDCAYVRVRRRAARVGAVAATLR